MVGRYAVKKTLTGLSYNRMRKERTGHYLPRDLRLETRLVSGNILRGSAAEFTSRVESWKKCIPPRVELKTCYVRVMRKLLRFRPYVFETAQFVT